jgi:hypothetical protein
MKKKTKKKKTYFEETPWRKKVKLSLCAGLKVQKAVDVQIHFLRLGNGSRIQMEFRLGLLCSQQNRRRYSPSMRLANPQSQY